MELKGKVIIVGTGIGGLALAAGLEKASFGYEIYEQHPSISPAGFGLSVNANASKALALMGLDRVNTLGQPYSLFEFLKTDGSPIAEIPIAAAAEKLGSPSFAVGRDDLQNTLLSYLDERAVFTGHELTHFEQDENSVRAYFSNGHVAEGSLLVGAEGVYSPIRKQLYPDSEILDSCYVAWLANMMFDDDRLPAGYNCHFWGKGSRFGFHDIGAGRKYWWGTKNVKHPPADRSTVKLSEKKPGRTTKQDILNQYATWRDDISNIIRATPDDQIIEVYFREINPLKQWSTGRVTLLGDSAHAMMPSLGQGACMAIEDAFELIESLKRCSNLGEALQRYDQHRIPITTKYSKTSKQICAVEQLNNTIGVAIRNFIFSHIPKSVYFKQQIDVGRFPRYA